jgi:hypothetical protein
MARTGTLSLKVALEDVGFGPCYHMTEVFQHPEHAKSGSLLREISLRTGTSFSPAIRLPLIGPAVPSTPN